MKRFIEMSDIGRMVLARMDNICDSLVPSDIRVLLGEIEKRNSDIKILLTNIELMFEEDDANLDPEDKAIIYQIKADYK